MLDIKVGKYRLSGGLTEGEAKLVVLRTNQAYRAEIARLSGDTELMKKHRNVANHLDNSLQGGLHISNPNPSRTLANLGANQLLVGGVVNQAAVRIGSAFNLPTNSKAFNLDFSPTDEQASLCSKQSRETAIAELANSNLSGTAYNRKLSELSRKYLAECREIAAMENIIDKHLENAGPVMLYQSMPQNQVTFNAAIGNKLFQQKAWVAESAKVTTLSQDIVETIVENGILRHLENTPEGIFNNLSPYMTQGGAALGCVDPATCAILATKIINIATPLIAATLGFVNAIKERRANVFRSVKDPSTFSPLQEDFNGNGIPDSEETVLQSLLTLPNILMAGGVGALAYGLIQNSKQKT